MKVLIDITHPAYAHYFKMVVPALRARGHRVLVTSRDKDVALRLLDAAGLDHTCLSRAGRSRPGLLWEMVVRDWRLMRVVRQFRPDVLVARDGLFASQVGWLCGVPAVSFDDTDDAPIQHRLYFPFARRIYTDHAYPKHAGAKHRHYKGVSSLAYLHPAAFRPDPEVLRQAGIDPHERIIVCRFVSWTANHDYGHRGFELDRLRETLRTLSRYGRVVVSSEVPLPKGAQAQRIPVPPEQIHHLLALAALYIGESSSMAHEAAVLGVPAIHVSTRRPWHVVDLEENFGLVHNVSDCGEGLQRAIDILKDPGAGAAQRDRRDRYLAEADDLVAVTVHAIEEAGCNGVRHNDAPDSERAAGKAA